MESTDTYSFILTEENQTYPPTGEGILITNNPFLLIELEFAIEKGRLLLQLSNQRDSKSSYYFETKYRTCLLEIPSFFTFSKFNSYWFSIRNAENCENTSGTLAFFPKRPSILYEMESIFKIPSSSLIKQADWYIHPFKQ